MKYPQILIVEDDEDIRTLCHDLLESEGFAAETCANGQEALDYLGAHSEPCLILLDMMMPVMGGREFMAAFAKQRHTIVPIPVFLVSASAGSAESEEMGCLGFLRKPFDVSALLAIVRSHCERIHPDLEASLSNAARRQPARRIPPPSPSYLSSQPQNDHRQ